MIPMPRSLSGRLILSALVVTIIATGVTGAAMDFALRRFIRGQVDGRLDGQIASIEDALRAGPDGQIRLEHIVDGPPFDRPLSGWYWKAASASGALKSRSLLTGDFDIKRGLLGMPEDRPHPAPLAGLGPSREPLHIRGQHFTLGGRSIFVTATAPEKALSGPLHDAMIPLSVTLCLLAAMLIGGALSQVRLGLRPLRALTLDLAGVRTGRAARITRPQPVEISPLVAELNSLLDQSEANLERARRHTSNLAHGLKTPLATMALLLDEKNDDTAKTLRPLVTVMDRLIRHHLTRARMAVMDGPMRARVLLASKVADHIEIFEKLSADKQLSLTASIPADLAVACDSQDLDEILGNLLDNACKWAKKRVVIEASVFGQQIALSVEDDGPGLTDEQAVHALRPGQRIDENTPGYGFGLPIVQELAELYGGAMSFSRSDMEGLKVTVLLPVSL